MKPSYDPTTNRFLCARRTLDQYVVPSAVLEERRSAGDLGPHLGSFRQTTRFIFILIEGPRFRMPLLPGSQASKLLVAHNTFLDRGEELDIEVEGDSHAYAVGMIYELTS